ncbi:uncharacterized protein LOC133502607 [Syngnathoides biaculeatus]|uniref:uncharacterized protein LOC133502607 n=1 Tax=Syngnathoides biaculeatus TaxID=300417 RepID=UPI002ADDA111|nr:uncharacterized protein LOC133502607 [Syngnathoides biaculeatus]
MGQLPWKSSVSSQPEESTLTEDIGTNDDTSTSTLSTASQKHSRWVEPMDLMSLVTENEILKRDYAKCTLEHLETKRHLNMLEEKSVFIRREPSILMTEFSLTQASTHDHDDCRPLCILLWPQQHSAPAVVWQRTHSGQLSVTLHLPGSSLCPATPSAWPRSQHDTSAAVSHAEADEKGQEKRDFWCCQVRNTTKSPLNACFWDVGGNWSA